MRLLLKYVWVLHVVRRWSHKIIYALKLCEISSNLPMYFCKFILLLLPKINDITLENYIPT